MANKFPLFLIMFYIHHNIARYDNTLFYSPYFHVSYSVILLHGTLVLSIDVVLALSIIDIIDNI